MDHIVSLSGGTASAVAADRVIKAYGRDRVTLWFADTLWEDEDLYRFLRDLELYWGIPIIRHTDGRTPLEVAEQASIIPNNRRAPCSLQLKIKPFTAYIKAMPKPLTVHLGLDFTETHRAERPKVEYEEISGVTVDLPLLWEPVAMPPHRYVVEEWGIETPRLYKLGFPHNNCGGRCVRQGIKEWLRLNQIFPERFAEVADWEAEQRAKGGARANYSISKDRKGGVAKPLPLYDLANIKGEQLNMNVSNEDTFGCMCSY
mgnify:CR=1 FL=1